VTTNKNNYASIDHGLTDLGYHINSSDIECLCDMTITLSDIDHGQLETLLSNIEDDDDVEKVWTNTL
jgi:transcriptional/translational regulatory protein YebC/TACO1